jgi:hypothetical protein
METPRHGLWRADEELRGCNKTRQPLVGAFWRISKHGATFHYVKLRWGSKREKLTEKPLQFAVRVPLPGERDGG